MIIKILSPGLRQFVRIGWAESEALVDVEPGEVVQRIFSPGLVEPGEVVL